MKNVLILGSTGSIGINTLKVIRRHHDRFRVVGLTAYNNLDAFERQIREFGPRWVAIRADLSGSLRQRLGSRGVRILDVDTDLEDLVSMKSVDIVVIAMRGAAALRPFLKAVQSGKTVLPANKEALVIGGNLLIKAAKKSGARIIPIDSEQSAIFQCLEQKHSQEIRRIVLTASGGPLLKIPASRFARVTREQVLKHPRWNMGAKITVDSATMMNKGFEVIEAKRLFGIDAGRIEVVIHPEAIIHSMVEFEDASILAQLANPDMRLPIQYALTYPDRLPCDVAGVDFFGLKQMTFEKPDVKKFPCLQLCYDVAKAEGTLPSVLNAADEEAVELFLQNRIRLTDIYRLVAQVVAAHHSPPHVTLDAILAADRWAREEIKRKIHV